MKQKKLKFTLLGIAVFTGFGIAFIVKEMFDAVIWSLLLGYIAGLIAVFAKFNHDDKELIINKEGK